MRLKHNKKRNTAFVYEALIRSLVESIIPWASTWLFYFEDWLDVGEWRGGGVEHSDEDNEQ